MNGRFMTEVTSGVERSERDEREEEEAKQGMISSGVPVSALSLGKLWNINDTAGFVLPFETKELGFCALTSVCHWQAASG